MSAFIKKSGDAWELLIVQAPTHPYTQFVFFGLDVLIVA